MTAYHPTVLVTFNCGHTNKFQYPAPTIGEEVYCRRCNDYRLVVADVEDYRIKCRDCRVAKPYGRDKITALRRASSHALRFSGHRVDVYDGQSLLDTVSTVGSGDVLPFDGEAGILNNSAVKGHQAVLRQAIDSVTDSLPAG